MKMLIEWMRSNARRWLEKRKESGKWLEARKGKGKRRSVNQNKAGIQRACHVVNNAIKKDECSSGEREREQSASLKGSYGVL